MVTVMDSTEFGFDALFVDEIRDDFKCVVCHLVLRNPVQIMSCGHRFCSPCFDRMRDRAEQSQAQLECPVDRELVSMKEVFPDRGITRTIGNLKVRCCNVERGCGWVDDLRELNQHEQQCEYRVVPRAPVVPDISGLSFQDNRNDVILQQILSRLEKCEEDSATKDKEMALLKATVANLKDDTQTKDAIIQELKSFNAELKQHVELLSRATMTKDQVDKAIDVKMQKLKAKLLDRSKYGDRRQENEITFGIRDPKRGSGIDEKSMALVQKNIKDIQSSKTNMNLVKKEIDLNKKECLHHITNIENVLFMKNSSPAHDIEFEWVMQNYEHYRNLGEKVWSPMFHTFVDGYCCQLYVGWCGQNKEQIDVFLSLSRWQNVGFLVPFNREYTITLAKDRGGFAEHRVVFQSLAKERVDCFTIKDGEDRTTCGYGYSPSDPAHHFVINDSLFISCTVHC